jgi:hypothetical protein
MMSSAIESTTAGAAVLSIVFSPVAAEGFPFGFVTLCCPCASCTLSCKLCFWSSALCTLAGRSSFELHCHYRGFRSLIRQGPLKCSVAYSRTGWCCGRKRVI